MLNLLTTEIDSKVFILCIVAMGVLVPIIYSIVNAARSATVSKEREQTRRELAAYVAEGSMTADEAERPRPTRRPGRHAKPPLHPAIPQQPRRQKHPRHRRPTHQPTRHHPRLRKLPAPIRADPRPRRQRPHRVTGYARASWWHGLPARASGQHAQANKTQRLHPSRGAPSPSLREAPNLSLRGARLRRSNLNEPATPSLADLFTPCAN